MHRLMDTAVRYENYVYSDSANNNAYQLSQNYEEIIMFPTVHAYPPFYEMTTMYFPRDIFQECVIILTNDLC